MLTRVIYLAFGTPKIVRSGSLVGCPAVESTPTLLRHLSRSRSGNAQINRPARRNFQRLAPAASILAKVSLAASLVGAERDGRTATVGENSRETGPSGVGGIGMLLIILLLILLFGGFGGGYYGYRGGYYGGGGLGIIGIVVIILIVYLVMGGGLGHPIYR
jgi:hypothetical protein